MPRVVRDPDDQYESATRLLARSLLQDVCPWLYGEATAPRALHTQPWKVRWTRPTIRTALQYFVATYHRVPSRQDWHASRQYCLPSLTTIKTVYGSRRAALLDAGLREESGTSPKPPAPATKRAGWRSQSISRVRAY